MDSQDSPFKCVVDSGAFYTGFVFLSSSTCRYYTSEAVFREVKHIKSSHGALEALLESNTLQILGSDRKNIEKVVVAARRTGDYQKLSQADISIIALALQLKLVLVTNDYAVANVASNLEIPVKSVASKGIARTRRWIAYCSACGIAFGPNARECRLCGNRLRRKYKLI